MAPPKANKNKRKANESKEPTESHDHSALELAAPSTSRARSPIPKVPKLVEHHSFGTISSEVLTFGTGDTGQLGLGPDLMERKKPAKVTLEDGDPANEAVVQVSAGGMHTMCLTKDGIVYSWGCNDEGSLGRLADDGTALQDEDECSKPGQVMFPEGTAKIVQISAGDSHSAALTHDGNVFFWGGWRDNSGIMSEKFPSPRPIPLPGAVTKITSGCHHILFLISNGHVFSMGCGENGQLGRLSERFATRNARNWQADLMTPAQVPLKYAFKKGLSKSGETVPALPRILAASNVWAGGFTSMVQLESGHVLGFGLNSSSQLGMPAAESNEASCVFQPKFLPNISSLEVKDISCGHHHTLILSNDGVVYACGLKEYGALGFGETQGVVDVPTKVDVADDPIKTIAAGTHLSFAVTDNGAMYSWGSATNNALGHGDEEDKEEPEEVTSKQLETRDVVAVSVGGQHSTILAVANNNNGS